MKNCLVRDNTWKKLKTQTEHDLSFLNRILNNSSYLRRFPSWTHFQGVRRKILAKTDKQTVNAFAVTFRTDLSYVRWL